MQKTVNVTFRVEEKVKKQADALFSDLGLSLSAAFNIFLRQAVREQQIPFAVSKNPDNVVRIPSPHAFDINKSNN
ncbi:MAG: type II toxin-antitoxin system RelB/DinJ family antitoxin [Clostridia bacterium]|nr:type II toxin-antitoxin system RelB/DinJ family antitoxin [Clostridia bacterium]